MERGRKGGWRVWEGAYHLEGVVQLVLALGELLVGAAQSVAQPLVLQLALLPELFAAAQTPIRRENQ